ncbi:MAG: ATP-binding protein [Lachnospiraceae bacterium]|nr:ATP-binding protein [Lachnospiraceae bacterium]
MKELILEAKLDKIPELTAVIDTELEALDCPMKAQMQIDVAVDELYSNIARYAYPDGDGTVTVHLEAEESPASYSITFIDSGVPFDPLAQTEPDTSLDADSRPIGGLGILLVRRTMDEVTYCYKDGKNVLRIKKIF